MKKFKISTSSTILSIVVNALFMFQCQSPELVPVTPKNGSYRIAADKALPGKIEAENYDAMQGVQNETVSDEGGGQDVGYIEDTDWMDYNVNVANTDTYTIKFRVSSPEGAGVFNVQTTTGQVLGTVTTPKTGGWQTWTTTSVTVKLTAGAQTLRVYCVKGGWNLNWFEAVQNNPTASSDYKTLPAKIEAENYDDSKGIAVEGTKDVDGNKNITSISDNDWLAYKVAVSTAGTYQFNFRVAGGGGTIQLRDAQGTVLKSLTSPNTGNGQTWQTISTTAPLAAGNQLLTLYASKGGWKLNWFEVVGGTNNVATDTKSDVRQVGTGSGDLSVDGKALGVQAGETISIVAGNYRSISLNNLVGTSDNRIVVQTSGPVQIVGGSLNLTNVQYTTVTGKSDSDPAAKNILVRDNTYRATQLTNCSKGLTLEKIKYLNISDYSIFNNSSSKTYTGSDESVALLDFKLLSMEWENAGGVGFGGSFSSSSNTGFCKNLEIANCTYKNRADAGNVFVAGNAENYDIHDNVVDNVNTINNNHNGIFLITGNGSFYNNKCTNHEGQLLRAWTFSQGGSVRDVKIFNNIVWNSRKYSAFEVQSFSSLVVSGRSTYANAKIYNNTAGKLDVEGVGFVGVVVDVYGLQGGTAEIYNNLSFSQKNPGKSGGVYSIQYDVKIIAKNNLFYSTATAAGLIDEKTFNLSGVSACKAAGILTSLLNTDYYWKARNTKPSVGAVE